VVYGNGLPLAVVELKNPVNEKADIWAEFRQLRTYKTDIPDLLIPNVLLVISDGLEAWVGSLSAAEERFLHWRTIDPRDHPDPDPLGQHRDLETMVQGLFQPQRFLEFMRSFCLFEENGAAMDSPKPYRDALPAATSLAFTGTPLSRDDRDTRAVFGNYVSVYDIQQAMEDGATVPIARR